jgi:hypothetical protein
LLLSLAQWLQATNLFTYLRESRWPYPIILSLHMVAIAFFGGMIAMTDLRLLGLAMRNRSVSDVIDQLRVPKRVGFVVMVMLGFLLFGCKAEEYYYNAFFRAKITLLCLVAVHAAIFRGSVYNAAENLDRSGPVSTRAKLAAILSLLLWAAIACMGRGVGYLDPPFGIQAWLSK